VGLASSVFAPAGKTNARLNPRGLVNTWRTVPYILGMDEKFLTARFPISFMEDAEAVELGAHASAGSGTADPREDQAHTDHAGDDTALLDAYSKA